MFADPYFLGPSTHWVVSLARSPEATVAVKVVDAVPVLPSTAPSSKPSL